MTSVHFPQPLTSFHSHALRLVSAGGPSANLHLGYGGTLACLWSISLTRGLRPQEGHSSSDASFSLEHKHLTSPYTHATMLLIEVVHTQTLRC